MYITRTDIKNTTPIYNATRIQNNEPLKAGSGKLHLIRYYTD